MEVVIKIVFVDDHPAMLSGLAQIFSNNPDFLVAGVGGTAADISRLAEDVSPDVVVTDLSMPGDVLAEIIKVAERPMGPRVLAFTASTSIDHTVRVLEAGALGYVLKGSTIEELCEAIRSVYAGQTFITPGYAVKVVAGLRAAAQRSEEDGPPQLSVREQQVLKRLRLGMTNKEIADELELSEKTVKHYVSVLMQKLHVRNRIEVVLAAQKLDRKSDQIYAI